MLVQGFYDGVVDVSSGNAGTDPADAVFASPCRNGVDT
jgi:hypothetical protein